MPAACSMSRVAGLPPATGTVRDAGLHLPARLCDVIRQQFQVQFGGFRDEPVGPHPVANVQVIFAPEQFQPVVEWLMLHRDGLDVLIHPLTDNSLDDHSRYAMWLGAPVHMSYG